MVRKLACRTFIGDEEPRFLQFLEREGLLIQLGTGLKACFQVNSSSTETTDRRFLLVAKQVVLQFEPTLSHRKKVECNEDEARMLIDFTCGMLQEFVRDHVRQFDAIVAGIKEELRVLVQNRRLGNWEEICRVLTLDDLVTLENDMRLDQSGEPVRANPLEDSSVNGQEKREGRVVWCIGSSRLEWLGSHLAGSLGWIKDEKEWVAFFKSDKEWVGNVLCKNVEQGNLAMLISMLIEAGKMKVIYQKGKWTRIERQFKGMEKSPWRKDWAKVLSESRKDHRIMGGFLERAKAIIQELNIKDEDIKKFKGRKDGG